MGEVTSGDDLTPPKRLTAKHDLAGFDCGEAALDEWLRGRALQNEASGTSRTYVVCAGTKVAGYYTLAVGSVTHANAPGRIRRNMPDAVPVMLIGRLAVDSQFHGRGIGSGLLRDAVLRTVQAAEIVGIRAILVHAKNEAAMRFCKSRGFLASPVEPLTVMIPVAQAVAMLED